MPASRPLSRSSMAVAVQTCRARRKAPGSKAKISARITNETSISIREKPSSPEARRRAARCKLRHFGNASLRVLSCKERARRVTSSRQLTSTATQ